MSLFLKRPGATCRIAVLLVAVVLGGCANLWNRQHHTSASVVDFLYPGENPSAMAPSIPELTLPLRVGIAFVPGSGAGSAALTEVRKEQLLTSVADHFRQAPYVKSIEVIPSAYLRPHGSFANLDEIRTMYGVDVIALVSYDQAQFTDEGVLSLTYWTIIGAYVVPGEKNDTQTMLDTVVVDIKSRKMLFRAPGTDHVAGSATPVNASEQLRADSGASFDRAAAQMIGNLDQQLSGFRDKVRAHPEEYHVVPTTEYRQRTGGGSLDLPALALCAAVAALALRRRRA